MEITPLLGDSRGICVHYFMYGINKLRSNWRLHPCWEILVEVAFITLCKELKSCGVNGDYTLIGRVQGSFHPSVYVWNQKVAE